MIEEKKRNPKRGMALGEVAQCRCEECAAQRGKPRTTEERMARAAREMAARARFWKSSALERE